MHGREIARLDEPPLERGRELERIEPQLRCRDRRVDTEAAGGGLRYLADHTDSGGGVAAAFEHDLRPAAPRKGLEDHRPILEPGVGVAADAKSGEHGVGEALDPREVTTHDE